MRVKGRGNLVTEADLAVEARIQAIIEAEYPSHAILSEETRSHTSTAGWVWVIDPIDGTRNFVSGIPFFCTNIALCLNGVTQLALTYEPNRREEFLAVRGRGLRVNGRPAFASRKDSVRESVLGFDAGYDDVRGRRALEMALAIWPGVQAVRIPGSAALGLAYAACGRFDVFVHHMLYPWDIAAGLLLIEEGGGVIVDRDGGPASLSTDGVAAGGRAVVADLLRLTAGRPWRD